MRPELAEGEVRGTLYGLSENGWMDQGLFDMWFRGIFLRYAPAARPLLLLLDGHSSHYCPETIHLAASQKVVLFTLPPNSTHLTQPLDRGVFGPLKVAWRQVCHEFLIDNPGQTVNHRVFSRLLAEAYMRAMTVKNIIAGFRNTGIYPPDREAVNVDMESNHKSLEESSGLAYIPLYTPRKTCTSRCKILTPPMPDDSDDSQETYVDFGTGASDSVFELPQLLPLPEPKFDDSFRVLTSNECIKRMDEILAAK